MSAADEEELVLGIETSDDRGGVVLCRGEESVEHRHFGESASHARDVLPAIDAVVRGAGIEKSTLDAVAVVEGPGSFTGLRVGVTCAKVLAYTLDLAAVGVPTLEIKAYNVDPAEEGSGAHVCPVQDARRGWVYATVFRSTAGRWEDRTGVLAGPPEEVVQDVPEGALVFGDGAEKFDDVFTSERFRIGDISLDNPTALWTARLGLRRVRAGGAVDPMDLMPRYHRLTAPEENLQRQESGA
ncbi:MAG: tRNA (adenosine(37)-N6)-threonylcarbamoyltransferase complex dimerization subunit type 1 TsaB [Planctomycetota bacterium]